MEIIAIANQKGGVGKSTTAAAMAAGLKLKGKRVLLCELDPQRNLSYTYQVYENEYTLYDALITETITPKEAIFKAKIGDILPADYRFTRADVLMADVVGKEFKLKEALQTLADDYDYCIIDTSPGLGILTISAFVAADKIIIPTVPGGYSVQGIMTLVYKLNEVKKYFNPSVVIDGILLTMFDPRNNLSKRITESLQDLAVKSETKLYTTYIRRNVALDEAATTQQDIFTYDAKSNGAADYLAFIDEYLKGVDDK